MSIMKQIKSLNPVLPARHLLKYGVLILLVISQSSCFKQYYQTNTTYRVGADTLQQLQSENKHFIVHTPVGPFALKGITLSSENLSGEKDFLNAKNDRLLNPQGETKNPMSRAEKKVCTTEVHLYTERTFDGTDLINLSYNQINRMDVYGLDKKAIRGSRITGIVVITLGVAALIGLGAAAANSSSTMGFAMNFH